MVASQINNRNYILSPFWRFLRAWSMFSSLRESSTNFPFPPINSIQSYLNSIAVSPSLESFLFLRLSGDSKLPVEDSAQALPLWHLLWPIQDKLLDIHFAATVHNPDPSNGTSVPTAVTKDSDRNLRSRLTGTEVYFCSLSSFYSSWDSEGA